MRLCPCRRERVNDLPRAFNKKEAKTVHDAVQKPSEFRALPAVVAVLALLGGCASVPPRAVPEPAPVVEVAEAQPDITVVEPEPEPQIAKPEAPALDVSVVLSSRTQAFEDVAVELGKHFESLSIYDLSDKSQPPANAFRLINDSPADIVVAVGLRAARSASVLSAVPVVFSQVFNYQDYELLGDERRGVSAIAPMDAQLAAWKRVEPSLTSVGLVIGPGHEALIEEAELAAQRHGVALIVSEAGSDQEALYVFKRMIRNIDGFWLLPDNRVLSPRVLGEIVDRSEGRGISVLVPSPRMLSMGAAISVSTVASDIAARIHEVVEAIGRGDIDRLPQVTPLTEIRVDVNEAVAYGRAAADNGKSFE